MLCLEKEKLANSAFGEKGEWNYSLSEIKANKRKFLIIKHIYNLFGPPFFIFYVISREKGDFLSYFVSLQWVSVKTKKKNTKRGGEKGEVSRIVLIRLYFSCE